MPAWGSELFLVAALTAQPVLFRTSHREAA